MHTVAFYTGWRAAGGGCELVVDHQHTEVATGDKFFDDHLVTILLCPSESTFRMCPIPDVDGCAVAMVPVERFDDDGIADCLDGFCKFAFIIDYLSLRNRHMGIDEQLLCAG